MLMSHLGLQWKALPIEHGSAMLMWCISYETALCFCAAMNSPVAPLRELHFRTHIRMYDMPFSPMKHKNNAFVFFEMWSQDALATRAHMSKED